MSSYINTRDLMLGETEEERAWQALNKLFNDQLIDLTEDAVKYIKSYAIAFKNNLISINLPELKRLDKGYIISDLNELKDLQIDKVTTIYSSDNPCLYNLPKLNHLKLYNVTDFSAVRFVTRGGPHILEIDCENEALTISNCFGSSSSGYGSYLQHLILRNTTPVIITSNLLQYTYPFQNNDGYIYVPSNLVDTYKAATNWSDYADYIYPIQLDVNNEVILRIDSITDTWEQILEAEDNGTYSTKYHVGDTKTVKIDGKDVQMQIVALDTDILENNNKAKITWVTKFIYDNQKFSTNSSVTNWRSSSIYSYLNDVDDGIYAKIETIVKNAIKEVHKPTMQYGGNTVDALDKIWLLSMKEIQAITGAESSGVSYSLFNSANARKRFSNNTYTNSRTWWLRSMIDISQGYARTVSTSGNDSFSIQTSYTHGVVFGFCT